MFAWIILNCTEETLGRECVIPLKFVCDIYESTHFHGALQSIWNQQEKYEKKQTKTNTQSLIQLKYCHVIQRPYATRCVCVCRILVIANWTCKRWQSIYTNRIRYECKRFAFSLQPNLCNVWVNVIAVCLLLRII